MSWEPPVFDGHPMAEIEVGGGAPQPRWRPWGIRWRKPKTEIVFIHVCADCERIRSVLFYSEDRWLCQTCRDKPN